MIINLEIVSLNVEMESFQDLRIVMIVILMILMDAIVNAK